MFSKSVTQWLLVSVFLVALVLATAGCSTASKDQGTSLNVDMTNFAFQMDKSSVPAGPVTFHVKNSAKDVEHEMVLLKTDLDANQLPTKDDKTVDEDKLESMGEVEVEPTESKDLSVTLDAGHYVLLCNEPGHYPQGMVANFTVK